MIRFRWVTLASVVLAAFLGCSGSSDENSRKPAGGTAGSAAGAAAGSAGGKTGDGDGGFGANASASGRGGADMAGADNGGGADDGGADGSGAATTSGGSGAAGGSAGRSGGSASGAGGGASGGASGAAPEGWTCLSAAYADGASCDCGCGKLDPDCDDESVESCDTCYLLGGCGSGACPSSIVTDDNTRCSIPSDWTCHRTDYGDGTCDCGCGVLDSDCASEKAEACTFCPLQGCANGTCTAVNPDDNTLCTVAPPSWTCNERLYFDGSRCDCGCGARDPDCSANELDACDNCNPEGSCSARPCPGTIDPDAVAFCVQPPPPDGWTCWEGSYAEGKFCDCGCGVQDLDCLTNDAAECDSCACNPERCPESVNPENPAECAPPPPGWTCVAAAYADDLCDCGCGVVDVDCYDATLNSCEYCQGCSGQDCERIDPQANGKCLYEAPEEWTCDPAVFADRACDCGCGALDADCDSTDKAECEFCDAEGSCSDLPCASPDGTIDPADNRRCVE